MGGLTSIQFKDMENIGTWWEGGICVEPGTFSSVNGTGIIDIDFGNLSRNQIINFNWNGPAVRGGVKPGSVGTFHGVNARNIVDAWNNDPPSGAEIHSLFDNWIYAA
jgi:hypothetical protein